MTTRTRQILGWIPAILVGLFLILASALPKLFMSGEGSSLQPFATSLGLWDILFWIGILELVCAILILIPRTSTVGFVLTTGLLGGATAVSLTHPEVEGVWPWFPFALLLFLTAGAYFRNPELLDRLLKRGVPVVGKARRIAGWVVAVLVGALFLLTAALKFLPIPPGSEAEKMAKALGTYGIEQPLGILQILIAILFFIPRTSTVGFVLMIGYWGGVLATNLSHGFDSLPELMPILVGFVLMTISAWGRNPELLTRLLKKV